MASQEQTEGRQSSNSGKDSMGAATEVFYRTLTRCAAIENNEARYTYLPGEVLTKFKVGDRVRVTVELEGAGAEDKCGQKERDASLLGLLDSEIVYYGPHPCGCGKIICRVSTAQGGHCFDYPEGPIYPNTNWVQHFCEPVAK